MLSVRPCTVLSFKRTLLALSVSSFSSLAWAEQISFLESMPQFDLEKSQGYRTSADLAESYDQIVDGITMTIDPSVGSRSYLVINGGTLNATKGATIKNVYLQKSRLNIDSGYVAEGIAVSSGGAHIRDSQIQNQMGLGLQLLLTQSDVLTGGFVHVYNSEILGASYGAAVGTTGELWLANSVVRGLGYTANIRGNGGLRLTGGIAHLAENTRVEGEDNGILIVNGSEGYAEQVNFLEIDHSTVSGDAGSAVKIDRISANSLTNTVAVIALRNDAVLRAGNGRLVDVQRGSTASVTVDDSRLTGDLVADDTSTLNVSLRNHARLSGNIINGNSLIINSSGHWQLGANNAIKSLAIDGGSVGFSKEGFHTLTVGQLSGNGVFDMRINLDNGTGDLLNIAGEAKGVHRLNIENTGQEAVPAEFDALRVVHTESGDARFGLIGGRADLGVYSYALEQQGTDWFIVGSGKIISPSTQSALALFNVGPTIWNSELTTLRSRMGEVRGQEQGGGWIRSYGSRFKASLDSGVNYRQKQQGLSFGADAPVPVSDGHLLVGLMGGYSNSDLDLRRGTSGEVDSYYVGAYGTWLSDDGYYLDGALKVNQFHNQSKVAMSDGKKAKGDYSNMAVGGSVEIGKHIKLPDDYFVEPYAQLSSVWIEGDSYTLDNGMQAKTSQTQSVLGKIGATVGRQFALKDGGFVQPYVRVAAAHEFSRSDDVSVNDQRFDNDLFGSRAELGGGVSVSLSERLQVHADFDYMKGKHVEQPWGANLGLRLAF